MQTRITKNKPGATQVCLVTPSMTHLGGGVTTVVRSHVKALTGDDRFDTWVLALNDNPGDESLKDWSLSPLVLAKPLFPKRYGFSIAMLVELFKRPKHVVHVHGLWMGHCLAVYIWSRLTGGSYVVTPHGMLESWILRRSPRLKALVSRLYQNAFVRRAAAIHVLTEKEREDIAGFVRPGQPVQVIPNYVDDQAAQGVRPDVPSAAPARRTYLFLGRIHEKKGVDELCEAWQSLCEQDADFCRKSRLIFCGWIDNLEGFAAKVEDLDSRLGNISFIGPKYDAEKQEIFQSADVFVLPSKSEGMPMAVLEAWAAGAAVVMTRECNMSAAFDAGAAIETSCSVAAIRATLQTVHSLDAHALEGFAQRGREHLRAEYSRQHVGDALKKLYVDIRSG